MTVQEQYQQLEADIRGYNPSANLERIHDAFAYANMAHSGQKRKSGEPYIIHPIAVARIVAGELRLDSESIEAALLHDVIEDTPATHEDIARLFSDKIADLVEGVSKCHDDGRRADGEFPENAFRHEQRHTRDFN